MSRPQFRLTQFLAIAGLALLAACAQPFEARVQSFQSMPPAQGQTFYVKPSDPQRQGSLEFAAYAGLVGTELQKLGFQPAASAESADLHVMMDFNAGPGRERIATRPGMNPGWGWGRGWYGRYGGWWGNPWYDPWGPWGNQEVYSFTVYPAYLHVAILRTSDKTPLFEGRAETTTRANDLPSTMPNLVTALFTDFPGASARSKIVRVPASR
ncbi:DUF4136 domain-containing protein [Sandaracinobacteroides sayramensis]|uniref:DUF4136 domain-containing protein n=1 Tax=Sandaracinobacteroides sayramensis TaxID=2913411 RepID=UPI001EDA55E3|nr:DUF4136 domain-containing protein [Sandaracinobacteroides sayramensis]